MDWIIEFRFYEKQILSLLLHLLPSCPSDKLCSMHGEYIFYVYASALSLDAGCVEEVLCSFCPLCLFFCEVVLASVLSLSSIWLVSFGTVVLVPWISFSELFALLFYTVGLFTFVLVSLTFIFYLVEWMLLVSGMKFYTLVRGWANGERQGVPSSLTLACSSRLKLPISSRLYKEDLMYGIKRGSSFRRELYTFDGWVGIICCTTFSSSSFALFPVVILRGLDAPRRFTSIYLLTTHLSTFPLLHLIFTSCILPFVL